MKRWGYASSSAIIGFVVCRGEQEKERKERRASEGKRAKVNKDAMVFVIFVKSFEVNSI
jgi:hypothetical protein